MTAKITPLDVQKMISHWLATPCNGYLGSDYGQDTKALLQKPLSDGSADTYLEKLKTDVSVLQVMPKGSLNLYAQQSAKRVDAIDITLQVGGDAITIGSTA